MGRRHRPQSRRQRQAEFIGASGAPKTPRKERAERRMTRHLGDDAEPVLTFWRAAPGVDSEFVYFIRAAVDWWKSTGPVKIGHAKDPIARAAELQCGNPEPLRVEALLLGTPDLERSIHSWWRSAAVRGEWFDGGAAGLIVELARQASEAQIASYKERGRAGLVQAYETIPMKYLIPEWVANAA